MSKMALFPKKSVTPSEQSTMAMFLRLYLLKILISGVAMTPTDFNKSSPKDLDMAKPRDFSCFIHTLIGP